MSDLFDSIAGGLSSILGSDYSSYLNTASDLANLGAGAYNLYSGIQSSNTANNYLNQLLASQGLSDELIRKQSERAAQYFEPLENLQATYALEDLQNIRPLSTAQTQYALDKGIGDIDFAQSTVDPLRYSLITQLGEGVNPQQYRDQASTDVSQAFDQARQAAIRSNQLQGINPNSGAAQSLANQYAMSQAAASAGARTEASRLAEDLDLQRKGQALSLWSGIPLSSTSAPTSSSDLLSNVTSGLNSAAKNLAAGYGLTNSAANNDYAAASAAFGNIGTYFNS